MLYPKCFVIASEKKSETQEARVLSDPGGNSLGRQGLFPHSAAKIFPKSHGIKFSLRGGDGKHSETGRSLKWNYQNFVIRDFSYRWTPGGPPSAVPAKPRLIVRAHPSRNRQSKSNAEKFPNFTARGSP